MCVAPSSSSFRTEGNIPSALGCAAADITSTVGQLTLGTALYEDSLCIQRVSISWGQLLLNDWSLLAYKCLTPLSQLGTFLKG